MTAGRRVLQMLTNTAAVVTTVVAAAYKTHAITSAMSTITTNTSTAGADVILHR